MITQTKDSGCILGNGTLADLCIWLRNYCQI